jgi:hypothetical protein
VPVVLTQLGVVLGFTFVGWYVVVVRDFRFCDAIGDAFEAAVREAAAVDLLSEAPAVVVPWEAPAVVVFLEPPTAVVPWDVAAVVVAAVCGEAGASATATVFVVLAPPQPASPIAAADSSAPKRLPVEP